ncbi:response regulator [Schlesneria sp. T3-172]|uniref:response regulator n=1 Tax=Schlesneria sphaerica TaxID=3373610 RepID=UPI0037C9619B
MAVGDRPKILIVEDEPQIRKFLRISLETSGYSVIETANAAAGIGNAITEPPDAVILDLGLPDQDGIAVIMRLREWSKVPIIVVSARGREADKVLALDAGADDYLTKPFSVGELMARVRVALRHSTAATSPTAEPVFKVGDLHVDLARREVTVAQQLVHLTPTEYRLLVVLVTHAGKVVTHRQLLKEVWGPGSVYENQYLRVYMGQLRRKIETDSMRPRYLKTEPGVGYRLMDD